MIAKVGLKQNDGNSGFSIVDLGIEIRAAVRKCPFKGRICGDAVPDKRVNTEKCSKVRKRTQQGIHVRQSVNNRPKKGIVKSLAQATDKLPSELSRTPNENFTRLFKGLADRPT